MLGFGVHADRSWAEFQRRTKRMDDELNRSLRKRMTRIARPIALEVRAAALAIPSKGGATQGYRKKKGVTGGAGLRQGIAAAVETKSEATKKGNVSLRIRVSGTKFSRATGKPTSLPRYMEGKSRKPWRHPIFVPEDKMPGEPGQWAAQSAHPFLLPTVLPHRPDVERAIRLAVEDAAREIGFK